MRKYVFIVVSFMVCLFTIGIVNGQEKRAFYVHPERCVAGEEVTFTYGNSSTPLANETSISGIAYFWRDFHWEAQDLKMEKNDTAWVTSCVIPADCGLVACKFYAGDKYDTGGKPTYATFTCTKEGVNLPSSYIGWGMLRNKTLETLPGYPAEEAYIGDDVMLFWINQQMRFDPKAREYVFYYAAKLLNKMYPGQFSKQMIDDVNYVLSLPSVKEKTLLEALEVASTLVRDSVLAAKVESRIKENYPDGIYARDLEIRRIFFKITDPEERMEALDEFLKRFPTEKFKDVETENASMFLGKIFQSVVYQPIVEKNDYSALYKYIHDVPHMHLVTFYWHMVQIPLRNRQRTPEEVKPFAEVIYNEFMNRPRCGSERMYSEKEWYRYLLSKNKEMSRVQALIMDATGSSTEALELMEAIKGYFNFESSDFNNQYVQMLAKNGYESLVIPTIVTSLQKDAVTPEMLDMLRKNYVSKHGNDEGFEKYVSSLKSPEQQQEMQNHLKETMINEDITLYTLRDLDGKKVDLSRMKGKIIVLDFWATWCAPCKASLPGMQMAVDKYKNDPNVVFYFISTMETDPNFKEKIRAFLKEHNYTLHVLCDNENPETKKLSGVYDAYCKAFHFSGIPHKMVIDGNGKLRWNLTGYMGSPSALAEEIGMMIEMLKSEK